MRNDKPVKQLPDDARILVIQTAFPGDVILTLPLIQSIKKAFPNAQTDVVVTLLASGVLAHHPAIHEVHIYDKHGDDAGVGGFGRLVHVVKSRGYHLAFIPHRSVRSALIARLASIPARIGFDKSAGRIFFTDVVRYDPTVHETVRNLSLLDGFLAADRRDTVPALYPDETDRQRVGELLKLKGISTDRTLIGLAPGSVWPTKRWPEEYFTELINLLGDGGNPCVLVGGKDDAGLCDRIRQGSGSRHVVTMAGECTWLQSAALIQRCTVLISNDSAPMHLATAMRTPVVAIFGPTVPEFGFGPLNKNDVVVGIDDLSCRPCTIHGGRRCPIRTFACMKQIIPDRVASEVRKILSSRSR